MQGSNETSVLPSMEYKGFKISEADLKPSAEKADAIWKASTLTEMPQLKFFWGLMIYYGKFLPIYPLFVLPSRGHLKNKTK